MSERRTACKKGFSILPTTQEAADQLDDENAFELDGVDDEEETAMISSSPSSSRTSCSVDKRNFTKVCFFILALGGLIALAARETAEAAILKKEKEDRKRAREERDAELKKIESNKKSFVDSSFVAYFYTSFLKTEG